MSDEFDEATKEGEHLAYAQKARTDPDIPAETADWMIAQDGLGATAGK